MGNDAPQPIRAQPDLRQAALAYFSMEVAFDESVPTYAGGLGVLAGDTIRAAADLSVPLVAVSLLHRRGYFRQHLDRSGSQHDTPIDWDVSGVLEALPDRCAVLIEGRGVQVRAWMYEVAGIGGWIVPVYLLDTDLPDNSEYDRSLTSFLYGGDARYRLCQDVVLGIGGVRMLRALGYHAINTFYMNEGHSSLLTLELLDEVAAEAGRHNIIHADVDRVRARCVFTTHMPVPAGHDQFSMALTTQVLGRRDVYAMQDVFCCDGVLNMMSLALTLSHYVNGVATRHGMVTRDMYSGYAIDSITNGVHAATWVSPAMAALYDRHIPGSRRDTFSLRSALSIPRDDLAAAHATQTRTLLDHVAAHSSIHLDPDVLTIGFARRMTAYKRPTLLFDNRHAIALHGSFFNTQRMVAQYVLHAYFARQPHMFPHLPPLRVDDDDSTPPLEEASNATR